MDLAIRSSSTASSAAAFAKLIKAAYELAQTNCTVAPVLRQEENLANLVIAFNKLLIIVAGVCTILTILVSILNTTTHLLNWTNSKEQKQSVRIIWLIPFFAIFSLFSIWFEDVAGFLEPIPQIYEASAICALFLLYVTYISPDEDTREKFYDRLDRSGRIGEASHDGGSLSWFHVVWILVFQVILVRIGTTIAAEYVQAHYCQVSVTKAKANTIVNVVQGIDTIIAVVGVIMYYHRMRADLKRHRALAKLVSMKSLIIIQVIQNALFRALATPHLGINGGQLIFTPTPQITWFDFTIGIPSFMLCCECFIFSMIFLWASSSSPYKQAKQQDASNGSFFRGIVDSVNMADILLGSSLISKSFSKKSNKKPDAPEKEYYSSSNEASPDSVIGKHGRRQGQATQVPNGSYVPVGGATRAQ